MFDSLGLCPDQLHELYWIAWSLDDWMKRISTIWMLKHGVARIPHQKVKTLTRKHLEAFCDWQFTIHLPQYRLYMNLFLLPKTASSCLWDRNDVIFVNLNILHGYWLQKFCRLQIKQHVCSSFLWWRLWICFFPALAVFCLVYLYCIDTRFPLMTNSPPGYGCSLSRVQFMRKTNITLRCEVSVAILSP